MPRRSSFRRLAAAVLVLALTSAAAVVAVIVATNSRRSVTPLCQVVAPSGHYQVALDQAANATTIAGVGKSAGLPDHAVTVALAAALQESGLHNLAGGDRDSVGLFQQRPSQGWGTPSQLHTPSYAASAFFRALQNQPGWETMPVTQAAQLVQRSAAPQAYAVWEQEARAVAEALTGEVAGGLACQYNSPGSAASASAATTSTSLADAMRTELGSSSLTTATRASQWLVASWLVAHASTYQITSVSFDTYRWASSKAVWTTVSPARPDLAITVAGRGQTAITDSGTA
jgi:hypothetical protein